MEKLSTGKYRCRICHEIIETNNLVGPISWHLAASSGGPQYRIVTIADRAVHSCRFPGRALRMF